MLQPGQQAVIDLTIGGDNLDNFLLYPNNIERGNLGQVELQIGENRKALPSNAACSLPSSESGVILPGLSNVHLSSEQIEHTHSFES